MSPIRLRQLIIVPNKYPRELGLGAFHPHTLGEGGRPWLESAINSSVASCIVSRSLLSRLGTRTTGRTFSTKIYSHTILLIGFTDFKAFIYSESRVFSPEDFKMQSI